MHRIPAPLLQKISCSTYVLRIQARRYCHTMFHERLTKIPRNVTRRSIRTDAEKQKHVVKSGSLPERGIITTCKSSNFQIKLDKQFVPIHFRPQFLRHLTDVLNKNKGQIPMLKRVCKMGKLSNHHFHQLLYVIKATMTSNACPSPTNV